MDAVKKDTARARELLRSLGIVDVDSMIDGYVFSTVEKLARGGRVSAEMRALLAAEVERLKGPIVPRGGGAL